MLIDANEEACCSTNEESRDWDAMTEVELKVALGRLVDKAQNGQELRVSFSFEIIC
jgi:hypothetical protein